MARDPKRQAQHARAYRRMNETAVRGLTGNAAILAAGAARNAISVPCCQHFLGGQGAGRITSKD